MSEESVRPVNPLPESFAGTSVARKAKRLFHAMRPKFFPASVLPVVVGTAWGVSMSGQLDAYCFVLALLATICVHAASNVLNDVGDETIGTDRKNVDRVYPYTGGSRFIQMGILSQAEMRRWGIGLLLIAGLLGVGLLIEKGPAIIVFGLTGVVLCVIYSLGPLRLASLGLGELAVAVGLGLLPVAGAAWIQGAAIDTNLFLFAVPISAWVAAILLINEVPDISADSSSGKKTLPVRLGLGGTAILYFLIQASAAVATGWLTLIGALPALAPLIPLGLLLLAWRNSAAIKVGIANRETMTQAIEGTLGIHTIGCLWLTGCLVYRIVI